MFWRKIRYAEAKKTSVLLNSNYNKCSLGDHQHRYLPDILQQMIVIYCRRFQMSQTAVDSDEEPIANFRETLEICENVRI